MDLHLCHVQLNVLYPPQLHVWICSLQRCAASCVFCSCECLWVCIIISERAVRRCGLSHSPSFSFLLTFFSSAFSLLDLWLFLTMQFCVMQYQREPFKLPFPLHTAHIYVWKQSSWNELVVRFLSDMPGVAWRRAQTHAGLALATRFHAPVTEAVTTGQRQTFTIAPQQEQPIHDTHAYRKRRQEENTQDDTLKSLYGNLAQEENFLSDINWRGAAWRRGKR